MIRGELINKLLVIIPNLNFCGKGKNKITRLPQIDDEERVVMIAVQDKSTFLSLYQNHLKTANFCEHL